MQDSKRTFPRSHPESDAPPETEGEDSLFPKFENLESRKTSRSRRRVAVIVFALIGLAGIITFVLNTSELGAFADQISRARPSWLLLAVGAQGWAFFFQSLVWWRVLRRLDRPLPLTDLFTLSIGKLFADQSLPSAGLSGAFFIMLALTGRGVPREDAFAAFVFGAASFIAAFFIAVIASFAVLALHDDAPSFLADGSALLYVFGGLAVLILMVAIALKIPRFRAWLGRRGAVLKVAELAGPTAARIGAEKSLFFSFVLLQLAARAADGVTLWLAFRAIGETAPIEACLVGVSIAALAATLAPTPMGIGTFEAGLVATLSAIGVSLESALTATLLFRGLSLWMPLAFGFFIVQRELLRGRKKPAPEGSP
jgi:uncharacterized membrane protein YbhN (UPF0104 family)